MIFIDLLESIIHVLFLTRYLTPNNKFKMQYTLIFIIISFLFLQISSALNHILSVSILIIFTFLFISAFFINDWVDKLFAILFSETLIIISNIISITLFITLLENVTSFKDINSWLLINVSFVSKIIYLCLTLIITAKKRNPYIYTYNKSSRILLFITFFSFMTLSNGLSNLITLNISLNTYTLILLFFCGLLLTIFYLYSILNNESYLKLELELKLKDQEYISDNIRIITNIHEENKKLKHDINYLIKNIRFKGLNEKEEQFLNEIENKNNFKDLIFSENATLNYAINSKIIVEKYRNIDWRIYLESCLINIDPVNLVLLFDNAIEYLLKNSIPRYIKINCKENRDWYFIFFTAKYYEIPKKGDSKYESHISSIIESAGGDFAIKLFENIIQIEVVIRNEKNS